MKDVSFWHISTATCPRLGGRFCCVMAARRGKRTIVMGERRSRLDVVCVWVLKVS